MVLPWFWLRPLDLIIRSFSCLSFFHAFEGRGEDRDIDNLWDKSPPHLQFTEKEEERGKACLQAMGIPIGAQFICLVVRDSAYLAGDAWAYHNYRDCDIQNFVLAAETLAERGYFVIRMGAKVHTAINSAHPKVIDYATNGMRSDFMDIYLGAKCTFCITTGTGYDLVASIFRRPIVYVSYVEIGALVTFSSLYISICKHHFSHQHNRNLTLSEIFSHGVGFCTATVDYETKGIELIENTPEEIRDVALEMAARLQGTWQPHADDEKLQRLFWEIFPTDAVGANGVPLHGEIRARYGAAFLRNNQSWLS